MNEGLTWAIKVKGFIKLLRPKQWIKNTFVFSAVVFAVRFTNMGDVLTTVKAALLFCMISSTIYILNDLADLEKDKHHPKKRERPLASGVIKRWEGVFLCLALFVGAMLFSYPMGRPFLLVILLYVLNNLVYTFYLKHVVILDVMSISAGFLLRVVAGAVAINVIISPWILLCTLLLSLFLGFSKRRHEIISLEEEAVKHRRILEEYSVQFIDNMLSIITASIVMAYSLYTFNVRFSLMLTIPFVLYGIFRYQYLLFMKLEGGSPEETVLSDKPLLMDILLWVLTSGLILYKF